MRTVEVRVAPGVDLVADLWEGTAVGFLLVHGLASNARLWEAVATALAAEDHAVAAVDLRGHGRSSRPPGGYDLATAVSDLTTLVGLLAPDLGPPFDRPVAVGQSWGGNVVLEFAYRHPGLTRGVACVDGGTIELARRFATWERCAAVLAPPRFDGTTAAEVEAMMRSTHPDWPETGIAGSMANFEVGEDGTVAPRLSREHHMEILRDLFAHRPSALYPGMRVPVLLVPADTGDGEWTESKRAEVVEAEASIPRARVRWFSPADHDIHAQYPDQLAEVLHAATLDGFFAGAASR